MRSLKGITLKVYPDWSSSGIWVYDDPSFRPQGGGSHYNIQYESLGLPSDLADRFKRWHAAFDESDYEDPIDADWWWAEGRSLAQELKEFVGPEVRVIYRGKGREEEIDR